MTPSEAAMLRAVPAIPRDGDRPVFREPWEARAFAMTLALHEKGLLDWPEWAQALGREIRRGRPGRRLGLLRALAGGAGEARRGQGPVSAPHAPDD